MVLVSAFLLMFGEVEGLTGSGGGRSEAVLALAIDDVWGVSKGGTLASSLLHLCHVGHARVLVLRSYSRGGLPYLLRKMPLIILDAIPESTLAGTVATVIPHR